MGDAMDINNCRCGHEYEDHDLDQMLSCRFECRVEGCACQMYSDPDVRNVEGIRTLSEAFAEWVLIPDPLMEKLRSEHSCEFDGGLMLQHPIRY